MDDEADFGDITDAHGEVQLATKFRPKAKKAMSRKSSKFLAPPNPSVGLTDDTVVGALDQNNLSRELGINQETAPSTCFGVKTGGDATVCRDVLDTPSDDVLTISAVDRVSQHQDHSDDRLIRLFEIAMHQEDLAVPDSHGKVHGNNLCQKPTDQETVTVPDALPPQDVGAHADLDSQDELMNPHTNDTRPIFGEPSAEQENDNGVEYSNPAGGNQKGRKQRKKEKNKKSLRGSDSTPIEESDQQNLQKSKSEVSSRGRKRPLKDTSTGQDEKKLTHSIRQKRTKEIKILLEKPDHEIDPMKLSVMHLRLLQEAREHMKSKTIPSGQSSNQSSQFRDTDNFDLFGENYDNDRPENHVQENATKLNYHSYMNRQTRTKWSKSDTDLFYQGLHQFGSDFAMVQQLFPDKTRDQVRRKFKSEEKRNPMQVHDAILHRSGDNLRLKQVIKQLNIGNVQRDTNRTQEQEVASHEGNLGTEALDGSDTNCSDKEQDTQRSEVTEGENISANADDNLDVFDWY